ncbi:GNAT family N-acetyltransferase [Bacillus sp. B1-b2]|uniref:GNAT family N-acetyltransferase n=1 Tax=Bacillus sp. B1-b2 TaxID=2653201 RepID=UPI0012623961|nr:GNAT family N-acetyltransferase [Bacillus sp. B1-b2]KAB7668883.1 GNAT family N-acetyltransferase [Bacillus sp. B1-b2]
MTTLHKATLDMLPIINDIYVNSQRRLLEQGILQWDGNYPNIDYFTACIKKQQLFVFIRNERITGHVVLNEWESEEWDSIQWQGNKPIIIHSLMIDPRFQGKGLARKMIAACENFAKVKGYGSVRLDAFSGNEQAMKLYSKLEYEKRGSIFYSSKPKGYEEYVCMEKLLV